MNIRCEKCKRDVNFYNAAVFGYDDDTQEWICDNCQPELKKKIDLVLKEYLSK